MLVENERICTFDPGDDYNRNVFGSHNRNTGMVMIWTTYDMDSETGLSQAISKMVRECDCYEHEQAGKTTMEGIEMCVRFDILESFSFTFKDYPWGQDARLADTFANTGVLLRSFRKDPATQKMHPMKFDEGKNWVNVVFRALN